ncbi:3'-5' exoribonuclease YhaM family protein [Crassaminicella indica]|uniref:HD domain-containing protein n=1 Tax=Crassaminicella indica TaxID=2855394 RepID=A0ABX8RDG7_9CLOT|nr:OB-fold nucleic acid binding domain-containing protein [Crassaminicella indica]QXM07129.1 HD domain-containing protein [Crassaminicella indica]
MIEEKSIQEFKNGDEIQGFFIVRKVEMKLSANNKNFLDFTLSDKTGEVNGKLWDCQEGQNKEFPIGSLIKVRGNVTEWKGKLQLKINRIRLANDDDKQNIEDYVQAAPIKAEEMFHEIYEYVQKIKNKDIKGIVEKVILESKEKLMYYPAAKSLHHAIRSGLMYHILRMLRTGEKLIEVYKNVNKDLLFAGILLHDIEKLEELDSDELGIAEYSKEGQLLGHISMGMNKISRVGQELGADEEIIMLLKHMVLSHHYEPEFGSPKKPMIPEGELLHYIDMIDARMYDMEDHLKNIQPGEFTDPIWSLDNRRLYKTLLCDE